MSTNESKITKKGPESFLHRRNEIREKAAKMRFQKLSKKVTSKLKNDNRIKFKRAERYLSEGIRRDRDAIRLLRVKNSTRNYSANPSDLTLVVRVHDDKGLTTESYELLSAKLGLKSIGDAVFIKRNNDVISILQKVKPYVLYGKPSQNIVSELVSKKAFVKVDGAEEQLVDNTVVEKYMGQKCGFVCLEDVSHEIFTMGKNFENVREMLAPFKIKLDKKTEKMCGNVKEEISEIVARLI